MKDLILGILLVTSLAFGSLFMHERLRTRAALADNTGLRQQVAELEAKGSQQEEKASRLRDRLAESFSDASAKADEVARLQQAVAEAERAQTNAPAQPHTNSSNRWLKCSKALRSKT